MAPHSASSELQQLDPISRLTMTTKLSKKRPTDDTSTSRDAARGPHHGAFLDSPASAAIKFQEAQDKRMDMPM